MVTSKSSQREPKKRRSSIRKVKTHKEILNDLHRKKLNNSKLTSKEKIINTIEQEISDAKVKHDKAIHLYVILFILALVLVTSIYAFYPQLPQLIFVSNILIAIIIFVIGIIFLNDGYKREVKDYMIIEEQIENLKRK